MGFLQCAISALLLAIWPLPDTIALRNLLLLSGAGIGLWIIGQNRSAVLTRDAWPVFFLFSFFAWLLIQYFWLTDRSAEHLSELRGVWIRTLAATLTGAAAGLAATRARTDKGHVNTMLIAGLCATTVLYLVTYLAYCIRQGIWLAPPFFQENYRGKPAIVVFVGMALVASYIGIRDAIRTKGWAAAAVWGSLILLSLFDFIFAGTKNGVVIFAATSAVFIVATLRHGSLDARQRIAIKAMIALLLLVLVPALIYHVHENAAWKKIGPDFRAAWNIEAHPQWKQMGSYTLPYNENMDPVNQSTYERVAWAHAGLILIGEHPLGYGLLHHSFGALAAEKWPDFHKPVGTTRGATHSAWIDLTLGVGLPGLLIVAVCLATAVYRCRRDAGFWRDYGLWALPTLTLIYLITEVASDLYIEFLFFMIAYFLGRTICPAKITEAGPAPAGS